jgi:hypothetical protein
MTLKSCLPAMLVLVFVSAACQPVASSPPAPTSIGAPSVEPSITPSLFPSTPAPIATPAPALRSFTEEFDGDFPYWSFLQVDNGQPAARPIAEAGFLVFDLPGSNQWAYALYGGPDYADVRLDAQVQVRLGTDGAMGLVCRYSEGAGWYEFNIYPDQTYMLLYGQWLAGGVARYTPLVHSESEKINSDKNEIGLSCAKDTLIPFVNGIQMRTWRETKFGLQNGKIGISVASFEDKPFMAAYDWVKVSEP